MQVRAVVQHQAAQLPAPTRRAIEALAVLRPIELAGLAAVLGRRPLEVADDLEVAVRAGLVAGECDRYVLRHDLDADGLRAGVPTVRAAHLHLARLEALPDDADAFTVLRHTEGASTLLPPPQVATARVDAGIESYRRRAMPEALALFDAALPDGSRRRPGAPARPPRALPVRGRRRRRPIPTTPSTRPSTRRSRPATTSWRCWSRSATSRSGSRCRGSRGASPACTASSTGRSRRCAGSTCSRPTCARPTATAQDRVPELEAELRHLADTVARDDPKAQARVRTLEARNLVDRHRTRPSSGSPSPPTPTGSPSRPGTRRCSSTRPSC